MLTQRLRRGIFVVQGRILQLAARQLVPLPIRAVKAMNELRGCRSCFPKQTLPEFIEISPFDRRPRRGAANLVSSERKRFRVHNPHLGL